jgi:hypothetical protein
VTAIAGVARTCVEIGSADDREMHFLIDCARASVEPERAVRMRELAAAGLNWTRLLTLAHRHGLAPLLYWHLRRICAANVPAGPLESLRDYAQKNSALSLLLTAELVRLLKVLHDNGIAAMPYKGPAIAAKLYGSVGLRQFCDLDILVRERDVGEASRLIEAQGFEPDFLIPETMRARFVRQDYVQLFRRDGGRTLVELHWGIAPRYFAVRFDADAVWGRLEPMPLQGATVYMPCPEDLLLLLCVHGARHGWHKLEGVCSIAELLRRTPHFDWDRAWHQSGEMHCRRMLVLGLLLAHRLFEVPVPPQAAAMSRSRMLLAMTRNIVRNFQSDGVPSRTLSDQVAFDLRLKDSCTDQMRLCGRMILMTTPEDWAAVRLPGSLSFVYPLVRAIRLARKHGINNEEAAA